MMANEELLQMSLMQLTEGVRRRQMTVSEIVDAYYHNIVRWNSVVNAFVEVKPREQLNFSHEGPLEGVPVAIKDLYHVEGYSTRAGGVQYEWTPRTDAEAVARLRGAGCTIMGKTNTHEYAMGGTTINPHFGTTRNPWDPERVAGGSSGGSAAAVAAGMVPVALGTDTAGSIRIPAAFCGLVGLKATYNAVPLEGIIPLSWSCDHAGPIGRTVDDVAAIFSVLTKKVRDFDGDRDQNVNSLRIGIISGEACQDWDEDITGRFDDCVQEMRSSQISVAKVELPLWKESLAAQFTMSRVESASFHAQWLKESPDKYGKDVFQRLTMGRQFSGVDYVNSLRIRQLAVQGYDTLFEACDLLVLPTVSILPPKIDQIVDNATFIQLTAPFNLVGLPAMTVPLMPSTEGLPIGLQIVGRWGREDEMFRLARWVERVRGPVGFPKTIKPLDVL